MPSSENVVVLQEEDGMRLDRWFRVHYPDVSFIALQSFFRSGQVRLNKKRTKGNVRVQSGQEIRIPPFFLEKKHSYSSNRNFDSSSSSHNFDSAKLFKMLIYEDEEVFIFNKMPNLAVQGGSGLDSHMDLMLKNWCNKKGQKPRLVHRLDRETSGVLIVARTRLAAVKLAESFRTRKAKKIYWSLVHGVPNPYQGKISTWLIKEKIHQEHFTRVAQHGEPSAEHAVSFYRMLEKADKSVSWLEMEPYTGRTHQLRVHAAHIGTPIIGDSRYYNKDFNALPRGIQNRLHLHAWRMIIPHPKEGMIDIKASLYPHMEQTYNVLGFNINNWQNDH